MFAWLNFGTRFASENRAEDQHSAYSDAAKLLLACIVHDHLPRQDAITEFTDDFFGPEL
jgi:hypothetical protein